MEMCSHIPSNFPLPNSMMLAHGIAPTLAKIQATANNIAKEQFAFSIDSKARQPDTGTMI